ncbi:MAG: hypothetical protein HYT79_03165 [Elusimicrobia bacterium]|nr:hypothetical protein [Elusimicrobiota bacterium]
MESARGKTRAKFVPRSGNFTDSDLIDPVRVADPANAYFGWLDANILHKLNDLEQEEYLLYCFYCHAAALDKSHQGLSDYGLTPIAAALKMSRVKILKARENLAKKHHLIAYRTVKNKSGDTRTIVQVLAMRLDDVVIVRFKKGLRPQENGVGGGGFSGKPRGFPGEPGEFPGEPGEFSREGGYQQGVSWRTPAPTVAGLDRNVKDWNKENNVDVSDRKEYLTERILEELGDERSAGFYRKIVRLLPEDIIHEILADTREADRAGRIRTNKARYFTDLAIRHMNQNGIKWRREKSWQR